MINNNIFKGIVGVAAASIGVLLGWKFFNKRNVQKIPSKQQTLAIIQNIRRQFYPLLVKIADFVARQLASKGVNPMDNEKIILGDPSFKKEIQEINAKVYVNFEETLVQQVIETLYKQDNDIKKQMNAFKQEYKKSLLGIRPEKQIIISRQVSKIVLLQVIKQLLQKKIKRIQINRLQSLSEQQSRNWLEMDIQEDEKMSKQLLKYKLGIVSKDSLKIFQFLINKYCEDGFFKLSYEKILHQYNLKVKSFQQ